MPSLHKAAIGRQAPQLQPEFDDSVVDDVVDDDDAFPDDRKHNGPGALPGEPPHAPTPPPKAARLPSVTAPRFVPNPSSKPAVTAEIRKNAENTRPMATQSLYVPPKVTIGFRDVDDVIDAEGKLPASSVASYSDYLAGLEERRQRRARNGTAGIPTGIPQLEKALHGHYGITAVAGVAGAGKTSFVLQTVLSAMIADPNLGVVWCHYEATSPDAVLDMMSCLLAQIDHRNLEGKRTTEEQARLETVGELLARTILPRMQIIEVINNSRHRTGFFGWTDRWRDSVKALGKVGVTRVVTVIDRFQRMPVPQITDGRAESSDDAWRIERIREASFISQRYESMGWPFFLVCELRKRDDNNREPELTDLLGSVGLGYDCARAILLHPTGAASSEGVASTKLIVPKARHGCQTSLLLNFRFAQFRFLDFQMPKLGFERPNEKLAKTDEPTVARRSPQTLLAGR